MVFRSVNATSSLKNSVYCETAGFGVMVNDPRIFILNTFIPNESSTLPMVTESLFMKVYSTVNEDCPLSNEVVEMDMN